MQVLDKKISGIAPRVLERALQRGALHADLEPHRLQDQPKHLVSGELLALGAEIEPQPAGSLEDVRAVPDRDPQRP